MNLVVVFSVFLCRILLVKASKCDIHVDITDGTREGTIIVKNGVRYTPENYFELGETIQGCFCNVKKCLRRCCADGQAMDLKTKRCVATVNEGLFPQFSVFSIINVPENKICDDIEDKIKIDDFNIDGNSHLIWEDLTISMDNFCLAVSPTTNETYAVVCVVNEEEESIITWIGMIISMPFLLVTFLVYLVLPDTTIHKRALTFYVLSLLLAYICLVSVQICGSLKTPIEEPACHILGYSIIFFFIVSFCWLNVMCVDMWLAFSGLARFASSKTAETKRFLYYCTYAWGTPLCLVFIVLIMNQSKNQNTIYHPRLGYGKCFLGDGYPNLFYFYLPMAILITINVVLFALTALKIQRIKRETSVLKGNDSKRHAYEEDKQKFNLYLKLMLAMGVNWSMEVISWLVNWQAASFPTAIWLLTDFANAAYGVFIFFIFVFKKKIWIQLKKRYYVCIGKPHKAQALSMTTTTRTSGFSTTESNLQSNVRLSNMRNGHSEERPLRGT